MPRPICPRTINHSPPVTFFKPAGIPLRDLDEVVLRRDEAEALRLVDVEDLYHAEAAARMGISRQTFDRIIRRAHRTTAMALVHGLALRIEQLPVTEAPSRGKPRQARPKLSPEC